MSFTDSIDFEMRGGNHPDPVMNVIERQVAEEAFKRVTSDPTWTELPLKTAYNFLHLNTFYGSNNPQIINLIQRLQPYPVYVEMEVAQWICPLKCIMCEIQYSEQPKIHLSFEKFKYAMDQFPDLKWAGNNALGDPFTNPEYGQMVKYLDDKKVAQEIYMTSCLLKEKDMKRFVDYKSFILTKFSLDGATKETYEKIRPGVDFDQVIANIKALDNYKRNAGKFFPKIEFHYIIMQQNIHEAEQFIDFIDSLDIRCTGIMFSRLLHYFPEVKDIYTNVPEELGKKLVEKGKQLGIPVYFNGDANACKPPSYNCTQWEMPYIFPDGTVIPCCNGNENNDRDWQRKNSMGNIFETPFREIWMNERYVKLRNSIIIGDPKNYTPVCTNLCAICNNTIKKE